MKLLPLAIIACGLLTAASAQAAIPGWVQPGVQLGYVGEGAFVSNGKYTSPVGVTEVTTIDTASAAGVAAESVFTVEGSFTDTIDFTCTAAGQCTNDETPYWIDPSNPAGSVVGQNGETFTFAGLTTYTSPVTGDVWSAGILTYSDQATGVSMAIAFDSVSGLLLELDSINPSEQVYLYYKTAAGASFPPSGGGGANAPLLASSVLPSSRSVEVGATATAFATVINAGNGAGTSCGLSLGSNIPANFSYQTTDPTTNAPVGSPNTPVTISAGGRQSFVFAIQPTAAFAPTQVTIAANCDNAQPATVTAGVNTLLLSASTTPVPDVVALAATAPTSGLLSIAGSTGAFAVASINVGSADTITVSANTGGVSLPLAVSLCQTNPANGQCLAGPSSSVVTSIGANATPTFAVFATASGAIPFAPGSSRIFVQFTGSDGNIRGATSVAVQTQ